MPGAPLSAGVAVAVLLAAPGASLGQLPDPPPWEGRHASAGQVLDRHIGDSLSWQTGGPSPGAALARSLLVPGWGQKALGQRRALLYGAAEVALWALWFQRHHAGGDFRNQYRDLAWRTARGGSGIRVDGPWAYYETLTKWRRSGAFDGDAGLPGVQPETDPSTFNGSQWALARQLFFRGGNPQPGDGDYQAALAWYQVHAYGPDFLWDWTGYDGDEAEFSRLIDVSDARFRQATTALGAVLANHLLSGVDAYLTSRVPGATRMRFLPGNGSLGQPDGFSFTFSWAPPS